MGVRQHLAILEAEGLVEHVPRKAGPWSARRTFIELTDEANESRFRRLMLTLLLGKPDA